VTKTETQTGRH